MKTEKKTFWFYWWWVENPMTPPPRWIRQTYSSRRQTAKALQAYDRGNGWKVGRVHRMRVTMPAEVLK